MSQEITQPKSYKDYKSRAWKFFLSVKAKTCDVVPGNLAELRNRFIKKNTSRERDIWQRKLSGLSRNGSLESFSVQFLLKTKHIQVSRNRKQSTKKIIIIFRNLWKKVLVMFAFSLILETSLSEWVSHTIAQVLTLWKNITSLRWFQYHHCF